MLSRPSIYKLSAQESFSWPALLQVWGGKLQNLPVQFSFFPSFILWLWIWMLKGSAFLPSTYSFLHTGSFQYWQIFIIWSLWLFGPATGLFYTYVHRENSSSFQPLIFPSLQTENADLWIANLARHPWQTRGWQELQKAAASISSPNQPFIPW